MRRSKGNCLFLVRGCQAPGRHSPCHCQAYHGWPAPSDGLAKADGGRAAHPAAAIGPGHTYANRLPRYDPFHAACIMLIMCCLCRNTPLTATCRRCLQGTACTPATSRRILGCTAPSSFRKGASQSSPTTWALCCACPRLARPATTAAGLSGWGTTDTGGGSARRTCTPATN